MSPRKKKEIIIPEEQSITFNKKYEKITIISTFISISIFITLICLISSNIPYIKTIRGVYTLQAARYNPYYGEIVSLYPTLILNITFISTILSILSKKLSKISKIGYLISIIITLLSYYNLYQNNIRVEECYFIILAILNLGFIIPSIYKLKEEEITIPIEDKPKYEKYNNRLDTYYYKKSNLKRNIIIIVSTLIIELISLIVIITYNNNDIYKETIIQTRSDYQLKITNNYINIRQSANTGSKVLGSVNKGDIYNILDITSTEKYIWYKIDYKGKIGYIASDRNEPYVKVLYKKKLVVNIFCTEDNENCSYLMDFILRYQKSTAKSFLIKYHDLNENYTKDIYSTLVSYHNIEETVPLILFGDKIITDYTKDEEQELVAKIEKEIENYLNLVDEIKKGNKLPQKKDS